MKFIRWALGRLILLINALTRPKAVERDPADQAAIDAQTANMVLYQYEACPFCVKVRRQLIRHALNIELRDAKKDPAYMEELIQGGGKSMVPCLRIENGADVKWLYESSDIISFLEAELKLA
ncbi:glutaredoxin family protein [Pseudomonadota bacterium]